MNDLHTEFDYRNPDYSLIYHERTKRLAKLVQLQKNDPATLAAIKTHYALNPWVYIMDWGMTYDPRLLERGLVPSMPFILWEKQVEFLQWLDDKWHKGERGIVEKSRDCGVTWLAVAYAVTKFLFVGGYAVGFGSRKEDLVDQKGNPDCIFEKIRLFYRFTPPPFRPKGFEDRLHNGYMKLLNPENNASITGEAGDNIGRGGRKSIYFVDEAAYIERQEVVDNALSQTTNCQIDISTPNGNGNAFYRKRMKWDSSDKVFVFDWRDDPRKDEAWYQKQCDELDEVTVAQEIDRDYDASQEDTFIPAKWVRASIDAHKKLGFKGEGIRAAGFDPADTGDAKALVYRHGSVILAAEQRTEGDITHAISWAFELADQLRADVMGFDADGMGAPAMKVHLKRLAAGRMRVVSYHGGGGVSDPDKQIKSIKLTHQKLMEGRMATSETIQKTNADTYRNFRSQTWTWVRDRFRATYEAVQAAEKGYVVKADPEELISIDSDCKCAVQLTAELSRPKRIFTENGKILVESKKAMRQRGVSSPNLADALIIAMTMSPPKESKAPKLEYEPYGHAVDGVI